MFWNVNYFICRSLHGYICVFAGKGPAEPVHQYLGRKRSNLRTHTHKKNRQNTAAHLALKPCKGKYDILTIFKNIHVGVF